MVCVGSGVSGLRRYVVVMPRWPAAGAGHLVRVVMLAYKSIDEPLPACKARPVHLRFCIASLRLTAHKQQGSIVHPVHAAPPGESEQRSSGWGVCSTCPVLWAEGV